MKIKKQDQNHWTIETQNTKITIDGGVTIRDFKIPGPGEFEIDEVEVEASEGIYLIDVEDATVAVVSENKKDFSDKDYKMISNSDILFIPVAGKNTMPTKTALKVISDCDPSYVIPIFYDDLSSLEKEEGMKIETQEELKVTKNDMSEEERKVVALQ